VDFGAYLQILLSYLFFCIIYLLLNNIGYEEQGRYSLLTCTVVEDTMNTLTVHVH